MAKILVTNITSDEIVDGLRQIVCDHTVESSGSVRKQALMICFPHEYEMIKAHGYYEVEDLDDPS